MPPTRCPLVTCNPCLQQILDIKAEAQDLITSLSTLSTFYEDNTPAARRALRSTIEKRGLQIHETFLSSAEAVIQVWASDAAFQLSSILYSVHCSV